jgi:lipid II:glycine glycyltransferase (peptidoglycan interpeptide bridge formation enzyme)
MKRKSASNFYFFDEDYFMRLFDDLSHRIWLARTHYRGETGAFGLFLRHERFIHYHLGCSDHELRSFCPTNLLLYETALLAKKRGKQYFHLGGGLQHNFGLYRFKKSFSDKTADFYLGQVIFDQAAYDRLVEIRASASRKKIQDDFFPAYRSPL